MHLCRAFIHNEVIIKFLHNLIFYSLLVIRQMHVNLKKRKKKFSSFKENSLLIINNELKSKKNS